MFGSKKKPVYTAPAEEERIPAAEEPKLAKTRTLIGSGIKFVGNIEAAEDIQIDGRVEGDIRSEHKVSVSGGGSVKGLVEAGTLILEGDGEGVHRISGFAKICAAGSFRGEMYTSVFVAEDGAEFEGSLHLKKQPAPVPAFLEREGDVPAGEENIFDED